MKKLLLIDDDPVTIKLLELNLKKLGYETIACLDPEATLEVAKTEAPDLILLDLVFPNHDGITILKEYKSTPILQDIPIIVLTSQGRKVTREEALTAGALELFTKPFSINNLNKAIESLLANPT